MRGSGDGPGAGRLMRLGLDRLVGLDLYAVAYR
jgi:hypothetical protein